MYQKLWEAATSGDEKFIEEVVQTDKTLLLQVTIDGNSVLHIAAKRGCEGIARQVSEEQPYLLTLANKSGDTPLHLASAAGHLSIVNILINHRPSSNVVEEDVMRMAVISNKIGNTALHAATIGGHLSVVKVLLSAAPKLAIMTNGAGVSALYMAAERGLLGIVENMLMLYPAVSHVGPRGQTALHAAVLRSDKISMAIIEKNRSYLKHQDASESTPLHFAAASGNADMLGLLLQQDASAGYMQDKDGFAIIHIAASVGNLNMIKKILEHCPDALEQKNNEGRNFVHVAVEKKNLNVVEYVLNSSPSAKDLLNEQDHEGNTPLHLAVRARHLKIIRVLLSCKIADSALTNSSGFTPVDLASSILTTKICFQTHYIMEALISYGSRFCPRRFDRITIHWLIRRRDEGIDDQSRALVNNLVIVAVLIATVSFAAAFTLPGGYKNDSESDEGMAILSSRAAFKAFLISDTLAMVSSVTVAVILLYYGFPDRHVRRQFLLTALLLVWVAVAFLCVAFATGVYSVVAPDSEWVAILVILVVCGLPFVLLLLIDWHFLDYLRIELGSSRRVGRNPATDGNSISVDLKKLQKKIFES
ncbi:protein ACCELERATED CELL DEATH 6-like [Zingiber officinale]|uniref:PGG domain-containing protein n=1 Tax=Zingiber officinale TaxID=94328 RepID=A0A8J5GG22_ZINOF|nr:protein ACCELERATED CELL DEATH 6-like [Zingiber officinale]KAG6499712.1 hypothetical protein ZIOFF_039503 [Zingiber officinale]